jgi:F420-dependent oxidoreductase-like protein
MDLRIFTEPQQGATYDDLLAVASTAEEVGFDAFFRSDHYLVMGESARSDLGPSDAWTTLAGLARDTTRIRLGTLLTAGTFRLPGPLAITVAQVDAMSGGRIEFGLGAGWYAAEHVAYGIPFPATAGERIRRLAEELAIVTGLWATPAGATFSFDGEFFTLVDSPALPKTFQQPHPPVIVGGKGLRKTPALAAQYADEFNLAFSPIESAIRSFAALDTACDERGRDRADIRRSVALATVGGPDDGTVSRRAAAISRDPEELRDHGLAGTPEEMLERLAKWAAIGVTRVYMQVLDLTDLDHIAFLGDALITPAAAL